MQGLVKSMLVIASLWNFPLVINLQITTPSTNSIKYKFLWNITETNSRKEPETTDIPRHSKIYKVKMESVMFNHTLKWEEVNEHVNYTVRYRFNYNANDKGEWQKKSECTNISRSFCDMSEWLEALLKYDITVITTNTEYNYDVITFKAQHDTKLLPPNCEATRHENILFIQPSTEHFETSQSKFNYFDYQVKYWPKGSENFEKNKVKILSSNSDQGNEIVIKLEETSPTYCFCIRLYSSMYINHTTESSPWGNVTCLEGNDGDDDDNMENIGLICGVSMTLLLVFLFLCCVGWKKFKKITTNEDTLPDYLKSVKEELVQCKLNGIIDYPDVPREKVYAIDFDFPSGTFQPKNVLQPLFVDLEWSHRTRKISTYAAHRIHLLSLPPTFSLNNWASCKGSSEYRHYKFCFGLKKGIQPESTKCNDDCLAHPPTYSENFDFDQMWLEDQSENTEEAPLMFDDGAVVRRFERSRSRSRGYYSFSSDDIQSHKHQTQVSDWFTESDQLTETVTLQDLTKSGTQETKEILDHERKLSSDYVQDISKTTPSYSNKTKPIFSIAKQTTDFFFGKPPHDNLTYCSNQYGNIPDAIVNSLIYGDVLNHEKVEN